MTKSIPMDMALQMMSSYIFELKRVVVTPKPPQTKEEIELFEKMISYVFEHFNIR